MFYSLSLLIIILFCLQDMEQFLQGCQELAQLNKFKQRITVSELCLYFPETYF